MLPGGKLYVPGAEKILPNIRKLTNAARRGEVFLVSHGCFHPADDPEFKQFPPHCLKGTAGAEFVPEAFAENVVWVKNEVDAKLPEDLYEFQQIVLENRRWTFLRVTMRTPWSGGWVTPRNSLCLEL